MNRTIAWHVTDVEPADLLDAVNTIGSKEAMRGYWVGQKWVRPDVYLDWARRDLEHKDHGGWAGALHFSKLAVTRILDGLVLANHLVPFVGDVYPKKIEGLRAAGVEVPNIVHDLVIDPRNRVEHQYDVVEEREARHAVELAGLFIGSIREELERGGVVTVNLRGGHSTVWSAQHGSRVDIHDLGDDPWLFLDVFSEEWSAKVVNAGRGEIVRAPLARFTRDESIALARYLRQQRGGTGYGSFFFDALKAQAGI